MSKKTKTNSIGRERARERERASRDGERACKAAARKMRRKNTAQVRRVQVIVAGRTKVRERDKLGRG